ncbi:MocR-like transcription factor YczR [Haloechinothrix halophila]|uniref:Transcriptional regulator with HTH domain and aminotransferase domain n=1 Tax=Haloechinothrix halophila YIM 93223 TaxID=592678 RepID=W9DNL8_9PSEU|nr:PLP-dependent aminotransferase family protein [Haloechinothrix halophila]ETA66563.1 transcriptional regulator with HTH domain and aminotransferase domain [Haloechinothrix halophila YIM 93223]
MTTSMPPGGRISGHKLATVLGQWRRRGPHHGAADLAAAVEWQVREGRLPPGTRLPAERELASAIEASRTLVGAALERLREKGLVASKRGSGSWITVPRTSGLPVEAEPDGDAIDFARASPPAVPALVPTLNEAMPELAALASGTGYSERGLPTLRERIAARYTERGLPTSPDDILVTNGAHHAFVLALRHFAGPGDRVLVEQPSYPNAIAAVRAAHALPVPVPVERGWDVEGIEAALKQSNPRLAYLIADFHNPTGLRMDAATRQRLGAALVRARTPVVVDETMVELDHEGDPASGPPPLAAFTGDGVGGNWAISVGSAAKTYWGGLRIGWIRASRQFLAGLVSSRSALDLGSPMLEQLVLARLMALDDVLPARRAQVAGMRDTLVDAVRTHFPQWTFEQPDGGLSLWCRLDEPIGTRLAVAALNHGVRVAPGSRFSVHGGLEQWLRLPYALPDDRLAEAVARLGSAAGSVRGGGGASEPPEDVPVA